MIREECNVTLTFIKHSHFSEIKLNHFYKANGVDGKLFVNGVACYKKNNFISHCFGETGYYLLTFQGTDDKYADDNVYGMTFSVSQTYTCLPDCFDCIEDQCCPTNYIIRDSQCTCPSNSTLECDCPLGYALGYDDEDQQISSCHKIETYRTDTRNNILKSTADMNIVCSASGTNKTIVSSTYSSKNDIPDAEWIWTAYGVKSYDYCNVTASFLKHSDSDILLWFDSADSKAFYVNDVLCDINFDDDINANASSCFSSIGKYNVTFQSKHSSGSYGMSFKLLETYTCTAHCFDCLGDQCCSEDYIVQGTSCISPESLQSTNLQGNAEIETNEITTIDSMKFIFYGIIGLIMIFVISKLTISYLKRKVNQDVIEKNLTHNLVNHS